MSDDAPWLDYAAPKGNDAEPWKDYAPTAAASDDAEGASPDNLINQAHQFVSGMGHSALGAAHGIGRLLTGQGMDRAADAINEENADAYRAPPEDLSAITDPKIRALVAQSHEMPSGTELGDASERIGWSPGVSTALSVLPAALASTLAAPRGGSMGPKTAVPKAPAADAAPQLTQAGSRQSMGAAYAHPELAGTSQELQDAVANAKNPINDEALRRHINADTLPQPEGVSPLRLRKSQAMRDGQQGSDERNLREADSEGYLRGSIDDQPAKLGSSLSEIHHRATPDLVGSGTDDLGQTAINAIKQADNARVLDIRAKYKALADQNGGKMPIDSSAAANDIRGQLDEGTLGELADKHDVLGPVLRKLTGGKPLTFNEFENMRTRLSEVERQGSSAGEAARMIHKGLNDMPLTAEAEPLRDLANTARNAAAERFDIIKKNPAYKAAIMDNVDKTTNNLHDLSQASPQSDKFMDRWFTGQSKDANPVNIQRLKQAVPDADLHSAIEGSALNKLRESAGLDRLGGDKFAINKFVDQHQKFGTRAQALMSPDTVQNLNQLRDAAEDVRWSSASDTTNRSNSALTHERLKGFGAMEPEKDPTIIKHLGEVAADAAAHHVAGPAGLWIKRTAQGMYDKSQLKKRAAANQTAINRFSQDATKPGAGIEMEPEPTRITRATGGKAGPTDDELVDRLVARWKAAKRHEDAASKPMLAMPDEAIVHALKISGASL